MNKIWLGFIGIWILFLSGLITPMTHTPGILQAVRLNRLWESKKNQLQSIEADLARNGITKKLLSEDRETQEREIRQTLGYVAEGEWVFDFGND